MRIESIPWVNVYQMIDEEDAIQKIGPYENVCSSVSYLLLAKPPRLEENLYYQRLELRSLVDAFGEECMLWEDRRYWLNQRGSRTYQSKVIGANARDRFCMVRPFKSRFLQLYQKIIPEESRYKSNNVTYLKGALSLAKSTGGELELVHRKGVSLPVHK